MKIAEEMKEKFREIYETSQTLKLGINPMKKWLSQAHILYPKSAQTICDDPEGICNYFISRTTSGVMEEINNKAKWFFEELF